MLERVDPFNVSSIEQLLYFKKFCRQYNIRQILLDGDDTLWRTRSIFARALDNGALAVAASSGESVSRVHSSINQIHDELYHTHSVSSTRWPILIDNLSLLYSFGESTRENLHNIFTSIYDTPLKFIPGTKEGLDFLKSDHDFPSLSIVTHANPEWTWKKYRWLNLDKYFSWDNDIYSIDENAYKDTDTWQEAMDFFKVKPENCLVCGDSPLSDIKPVNELGVRFSFLVHHQNLWSVQDVPVDENKTKIIDSINDLRFLGRQVVNFTSSRD